MSKIKVMTQADMKAWDEKRKTRKCKGKQSERKRPLPSKGVGANEWDLRTQAVMSSDSSGRKLGTKKQKAKCKEL